MLQMLGCSDWREGFLNTAIDIYYCMAICDKTKQYNLERFLE